MTTALPASSATVAAPASSGRPAPLPTYDISRSSDTLDLAKDVAKFIRDNRLSTQVQGKEFVNVEGWQYAGSRLGIVPIVEEILNVGTDQELKYQAKARLFDISRQVYVGAGFAICSNKEQGKKYYQEFAIASMAQTRAIGKAYRNILAWIIRAAGYEPTPAEELEYQGGGASGAPAQASEPVMVATTTPAATGAAAAAAPEAAPAPVERASEQLREDIISLLNSAFIYRQEKTKVLLNINTYDTKRAEARIRYLVKLIEERSGEYVLPGTRFHRYTSAPAGPTSPVLTTATGTSTPAAVVPAPAPRRSSVREKSEGKLRDFVQQHADVLGKEEVNRLLTICSNPRVMASTFEAELAKAQAYVLDRKAA